MTTLRYDKIGITYNRFRQADDRIVKKISDLLALPLGAVIADIGAGSGNYSNALADLGYTVHAIEPSNTMSSQAAPNHNVKWHHGVAEAIPLPDDAVDGIVSTLASHHFSDLKRAVSEMNRICRKGTIVILTFDSRRANDNWFKDYFPQIWHHSIEMAPPFEAVEQIFSRHKRCVEIVPFFIPGDLKDHFMVAGWNRPELYLHCEIRNSISTFALGDQNLVQNQCRTLALDLDSGRWDKQYGHLRAQTHIDWGYYFLKAL